MKDQLKLLVESGAISTKDSQSILSAFNEAVTAKVNSQLAEKEDEMKKKMKDDMDKDMSKEMDAMSKEKEDEYNEKLTEAYQYLIEYTDKVVDEWLTENSLALEENVNSAQAVALVESFETSYMQIGKDVADIITESSNKTSKSANTLQKQLQKSNSLVTNISNEYSNLAKISYINEATAKLNVVQKHKVKELAARFNYDNTEPQIFIKRVDRLVENVVAAGSKNLNEDSKAKNQSKPLNESAGSQLKASQVLFNNTHLF